MPFWTLFWLIVPAVVLLVVGTWLSVGRDADGNGDDER